MVKKHERLKLAKHKIKPQANNNYKKIAVEHEDKDWKGVETKGANAIINYPIGGTQYFLGCIEGNFEPPTPNVYNPTQKRPVRRSQIRRFFTIIDIYMCDWRADNSVNNTFFTGVRDALIAEFTTKFTEKNIWCRIQRMPRFAWPGINYMPCTTKKTENFSGTLQKSTILFNEPGAAIYSPGLMNGVPQPPPTQPPPIPNPYGPTPKFWGEVEEGPSEDEPFWTEGPKHLQLWITGSRDLSTMPFTIGFDEVATYQNILVPNVPGLEIGPPHPGSPAFGVPPGNAQAGYGLVLTSVDVTMKYYTTMHAAAKQNAKRFLDTVEKGEIHAFCDTPFTGAANIPNLTVTWFYSVAAFPFPDVIILQVDQYPMEAVNAAWDNEYVAATAEAVSKLEEVCTEGGGTLTNRPAGVFPDRATVSEIFNWAKGKINTFIE